MTLQLHIAGQTDVGRHRQDNQDTFVSTALWSAHNALLVVIDGVGGYAGGAQAASLAREAIVHYMTAPTGDPLTMLREAVVHANNEIVRHGQQDPSLARMCCVLTAVVADAETRRILYVHVGDTRLYRFRQQQVEKLTHDHSLVGVREDANQLTEREAMRHPRRNEILRDVGSVMHRLDDPDFLESGETDFLPGDGLLLCSDGLTDMLTREQLTDVLAQPLSVEEQITELIRQANEHGGHDNITVVLAQYPAGGSEEVAPAPAELLAAATERAGTQTPVADLPSEPIPSRSRISYVAFLLLGILVAGLLWWQYKPTIPVTSPQPVIETDSSVRVKPIPQPDSSKRRNDHANR